MSSFLRSQEIVRLRCPDLVMGFFGLATGDKIRIIGAYKPCIDHQFGIMIMIMIKTIIIRAF